MPVSRYKISLKKKHKRLIKRVRGLFICFFIYVFYAHHDKFEDDDHYHQHGNLPRIDQNRPSQDENSETTESPEELRRQRDKKRYENQPDAWNGKITIIKDNLKPQTTPPSNVRVDRNIQKYSYREVREDDKKPETNSFRENQPEQPQGSFRDARETQKFPEPNQPDISISEEKIFEPEVRGWSIDQVESMIAQEQQNELINNAKPIKENIVVKKQRLKREQIEKRLQAYKEKQREAGLDDPRAKLKYKDSRSDLDTKVRNMNQLASVNEADVSLSNHGKCYPTKRFVFLKTHKTASTTLSNVCLRLATKRQSIVALPAERTWELGSFFKNYQNSFIRNFEIEKIFFIWRVSPLFEKRIHLPDFTKIRCDLPPFPL